MHYTGVSFSDKQIVIGDLYSYYIQYLANLYFSHPQIIEPFKNTNEIRTTISSQLKVIFENLIDLKSVDENNIPNLIKSIPLNAEKGFILSLPIYIKNPIKNNKQFELLKNMLTTEPMPTYWIVNILFL